MLTCEEKEKLSCCLFEAMFTRDFSYIENFLAEELVFDFPGAGRIEGKKRTLIFMKAMLRKYNSLKFDIRETIQENDRVCVVWTNDGSLTDGSPYHNSGMTLVKFNHSGICFISDYFKDTSFTQRM